MANIARPTVNSPTSGISTLLTDRALTATNSRKLASFREISEANAAAAEKLTIDLNTTIVRRAEILEERMFYVETVANNTNIKLENAGGDLSGPWQDLVVGSIQGSPVVITSPANNQILVYGGSGWVNTSTLPTHASTHNDGGADEISIDASQMTTGTIAVGRLSALPSHASTHNDGGADELALDSSQITAGTLADARIPSLDAAKTTTGVFGTARLGSGTAIAGNFLDGTSVWRIPYAPPKIITFSGAIDAPGLWGDAFTTVALVANTQKMVPYVPAFSFTPSVIGTNISAAVAGNLQLAIYASDPATGLPVGTPLNTPSNLSTASTGNRETAYTTPVVAGNQYWLAIQTSAACTNRAITLASLVVIVSDPAAANQRSIFNKVITYGTWIDFTSVPAVEADFVNGNMPLVYLRRA